MGQRVYRVRINLGQRRVTEAEWERKLEQIKSLGNKALYASYLARKAGFTALDQQEMYLVRVAIETSKRKYRVQKDFFQMLAAVRADMEKNIAIVGDSVFKTIDTRAGLDVMLQNLQRGLGKRGFNLYVWDGGESMAAGLQQRIASLGPEIRDSVELAVYESLKQSFIDAWGTIKDINAFPLEYRTAILERIEWLWQNRVLKIGGSISATTWILQIDFGKIFGDYYKLYEGFHYQALEEGGTSKVKLPYRSQRLKNSGASKATGPQRKYGEAQADEGNELNRYRFWHILWTRTGQKFYYPYGGRGPITSGKSMRDIRLKQLRKLVDGAQERGDYNKKRGFKYDEDYDKAKGYADDIVKINEGLSGKKKNLPKGIPIPPNARKATIEARLAAWFPYTPFWLYLEFGQFKWAPRIPPRGVFMRFYAKLRAMIKIIVEDAYRARFGKGITDPIRNPSRRGGYKIAVTVYGHSDPLKTGTDSLRAFNKSKKKIYRTVYRTAQEAERVAGRFSNKQASRQILSLEQLNERLAQANYDNAARDFFRPPTTSREAYPGLFGMMRSGTSSVYQTSTPVYSRFRGKPGYSIRGSKGRFKGSTPGIYGYS